MADGDFNWVEWARFINDWNTARQNKKNQGFQTAPMTPEQREQWNWAFGQIKGLPNASTDLYPTALHNATHGGTFDVEAARRGETAYKPAPPPSPTDLANIIKGTPTPGPTKAQTTNTSTPNGSPVDRGPRQRVGSDVGDGGNPAFGDDIYGALTRNNPRTSAGSEYGPNFPTSTVPQPNASGTIGAPDNDTNNMFLNPPPAVQNEDRNAFFDFIRTYGRAAAMGVLAIMTNNPGMAFGAAVQAWRAHQQANQPKPAPGGTGGSMIPGSIAGSHAWG